MALVTTTLASTKYGYVTEASPDTHVTANATTWYTIGGTESGGDRRRFYIGFASLPSSLKRNRLYGAMVHFQTTLVSADSYLTGGSLIPTSDFDASTITFNTAPDALEAENYPDSYLTWNVKYSSTPADLARPSGTITTSWQAWVLERAVQIIKNGACYLGETSSGWGGKVKATLSDNTTTYLSVGYDNAEVQTSQITYQSGPSSGYYNPANALTFTWSFEPVEDFDCYDDTFAQASATLYWKSSSDASYTAVTISGTTTSVTIPASTFPAAETISWYLEGTDEDGTTTQTSVYTFSTAAGTVSTACVDPVNQVIDGSASYTFSWTITSTDGQSASRTIFQWSSDSGTTWTDLFDENSHITSYTVPGGTFSAGSIDWRILAYNVDSVLGTYTASTFICVAAPDPVEGLIATTVPYSTISWQSTDQQAYQITIDGTVVVKAFGSDIYSYTLTEPLTDGSHTISVIVQGQYGYWSQASTITITIANSAGDAVTLDGVFGLDAQLLIDTTAATQDFYIYRDGALIGHTEDDTFTDRYSLGSHTYYVLNKLTDGNYTKSNTVTGTTEADGTFIALLNGTTWIDITISENSATEQAYKYDRKYSLRHVSGATYPVLELSPYEDAGGTYDFACKDYTTAKAFEALKGKEVIVKSRGDKVMFGAMISLSSHYGDFINGYSFTIQRIHVEDYVDDTNA